MRSPTQQTLKRWRFRSGWRPNLFSRGQPHRQDLILVTRTNLIGSDRAVDCQLALKTSKEPFLIATNGLLFENLRPPLTGLLIKNNALTLKFYIKSNFSHILRRFEQNASTTETKCSSSLSLPEDSTESSGASLRSLSLVSVVSVAHRFGACPSFQWFQSGRMQWVCLSKGACPRLKRLGKGACP